MANTEAVEFASAAVKRRLASIVRAVLQDTTDLLRFVTYASHLCALFENPP